ncbi:carbohydrate ABC transporter substrate-binding protein (CUT1 family) [Asanoa ferruginea]|uniref:Carbohydrate ABC transporter substrate-binding protein (CUT1 family) n=1 Tax=Asanoa ferruginea TaxID=53367 RepID=A0A3D9ZSN3_9ACTN|nr:extracellular solute-binding protein [Asanoa ferruginea]REG00216.1 carbohydrate ABC transporter substrate-binding protein (CUT1 family) [Asanoa ferruginea]GIF46085.1 sugar ABC transporter substrate-binding protein [Asanoa ferruginea]
MTKNLSRRQLLAVAGLGATAALTGCSSVAAGLSTSRETGTLDFWNLFGGGDGVRMQQMLDGYRAEHADVELAAVTLAWGNPYYTKLSLATLGDRPPEVAISHLTRMKNLVRADLLEELRPDDLARHGMTPDKFNQRAWEAALVDGKAYCIPIDTHPFVMFYNTDICQQAGLLDSAGKLTPLDSEAAFTDAMKKAKAVTGEFGGALAFVSETSTPWRMFQSFYSQLGGQMLADDGTKVVIDEAKATQVLTFMRSLTRDGLFPNPIDYQGSIAMFANGQTAFLFQGEWEITTFQTAKMPFSMTLFPNVFGGSNYAVQADSHTFVLPRQPSHDAARLDRSLTFVRSMLDQSKTWTEGGHVPLWLPFAEGAEYAQMSPQSNYASAADAAAYDAEGWYSGSGSNFEIITGSAIGDVLSGAASPQQAIAQMRGSLEQLAGTPSPL